MNMTKKNLLWAPLLIAGLLAGGCQQFEVADSPPNVSPPPGLMDKYVPDAPAGIPVDPSLDMVKFRHTIDSKGFASRPDPFALKSGERAFDVSQTAERFLSENGFIMGYEPKPVVEERPPVTEEQPYRRLSGVIVGESVLAIIEMGGGAGTQIIRPGQMIPNSEWRVVSIDEDKAILRRSGNKLPKEIIVRLESRPIGQ